MIVVWRLWVFALWFGTMFALITVAVAVALVLVMGAVVIGMLMPSRTVGGQLRAVYANTEAGIAHLRALRG